MSSSYRRRKRHGSNSLTGIIVFVLAAGIFLLLSTTIFFNVENIRVTGASNYSADEIVAASGINPGDNLVRTNTEKCAGRIESQLVYIENAKISRAFPNTMIIEVEASVPAANFICDDGAYIISKGCKVLEFSPKPKAGLLNFTGTEPAVGLLPGDIFASADEHKDSIINKLMGFFGENTTLSESVTMIDVSDRSDLSYTYDGRITVRLGAVTDIEYKINFSKEVITTKIGEKTEGVLTIMSDSKGASFLDKESLEHNAQVFSENMAELNAAETDTDEDAPEETEKTSSNDPIME